MCNQRVCIVSAREFNTNWLEGDVVDAAKRYIRAQEEKQGSPHKAVSGDVVSAARKYIDDKVPHRLTESDD